MTEKQGGTGSAARPGDGLAAERVVIRDRRKVDPSGGRAKHAAAEPAEETTDAGSGAEGKPAGKDPKRDADAKNGKPAGGEPADAEQGDEAPADGAPEDAEQAEAGSEPETPAVTEPAPGGSAAGDAPASQPVDTPVPVAEEAAEPAGDAPVEAPPTAADELAAVRAELTERTRDLQRVTAEYANYRKRVDRDRGLAAEQTTGAVLSALLPVLDDLDRAREHGDLVGPFGSVAEQLTAALGKFGLTPFGDKGDAFDPTRHEAVAHTTSSEVTEPTCVEVMRRGYLLGERLLRPALVAVADPE